MRDQLEGRVLDREEAPPRRAPGPVAASLILVAIYSVIALLCDPQGIVMSDVGTKTATLQAMADHDTFAPDIGYWAEGDDPDGTLHPFVDTQRIGDHWVTVTTVPMLLAAYPLWELGGYRLALVVPMLGGVACAFAAQALARRLGARSPELAFWVVGLGSPVLFYALELWEHTWGLACSMWAVALALDAFDTPRTRAVVPLGAGALFGIAATMRTEAFVYLAVTPAVLFLMTAARTHLVERVRRAALVGAGTVAALVANHVLEVALLGGAIRSSRTSDAAGSTLDRFGVPLREVVATTFGVGAGSLGMSLLFGAPFVVLVGLAVFGAARGWPTRRVVRLCIVAGGVMAVRLLLVFSFLNGVLTAFPIAIAGLVLGWRAGRVRLVTLVAVVAVPLVWLTEYAHPPWQQWGGRYLLTTGALLGVAGLVELQRVSRAASTSLIALTAMASLYCAAYFVDASHDSATYAHTLPALDADLVVARFPGLFRFAGETYSSERPWLHADDTTDLDAAFAIATAHEFETVVVLGEPEQPTVRGWVPTSAAEILDGVTATTYERSR